MQKLIFIPFPIRHTYYNDNLSFCLNIKVIMFFLLQHQHLILMI